MVFARLGLAVALVAGLAGLAVASDYPNVNMMDVVCGHKDMCFTKDVATNTFTGARTNPASECDIENTDLYQTLNELNGDVNEAIGNGFPKNGDSDNVGSVALENILNHFFDADMVAEGGVVAQKLAAMEDRRDLALERAAKNAGTSDGAAATNYARALNIGFFHGLISAYRGYVAYEHPYGDAQTLCSSIHQPQKTTIALLELAGKYQQKISTLRTQFQSYKANCCSVDSAMSDVIGAVELAAGWYFQKVKITIPSFVKVVPDIVSIPMEGKLDSHVGYMRGMFATTFQEGSQDETGAYYPPSETATQNIANFKTQAKNRCYPCTMRERFGINDMRGNALNLELADNVGILFPVTGLPPKASCGAESGISTVMDVSGAVTHPHLANMGFRYDIYEQEVRRASAHVHLKENSCQVYDAYF